MRWSHLKSVFHRLNEFSYFLYLIRHICVCICFSFHQSGFSLSSFHLTFECTYPDIAENGTHVLEPKLNNDSIKDSPFKLLVDPKPTATYNGPRPFQAIATRPCSIPLDVVNARPEDIKVLLVDPTTRSPIPHKIVEKGNGKMDIVFTPQNAGTHFFESDRFFFFFFFFFF
jgi:hypothetical protein